MIRRFILSCLSVLITLVPMATHAITTVDENAVINDTVHYIADDCETQQTGTATPPTGDNPQEVWNHLISKGLPPFMVAGIMGNMQSESHFDPQIIQGGGHSTDPAAAGSGGYGLVQWTPGSKVIPYLHGQTPGIDNEVDALMDQLNGAGASPEKGAGDAVFATSEVRAAAKAFMTRYERPKDQSDAAQNHRADQAVAILTKYGNGAPPTGTPFKGGGGSSASTTDASGCVTAASNGSCTNPMSDPAWKAVLSRTDNGVDYVPKAGMAINTPCDVTILDTTTTADWPGGAFIYAKFTSGPYAGKCWYWAETITNLPPKGTQIPAGGRVATAVGDQIGIEIGFAKAMRLSATSNGENQFPSPAGRAAAAFLRSLGAPTRDDPGTDAPNYAGGSCP